MGLRQGGCVAGSAGVANDREREGDAPRILFSLYQETGRFAAAKPRRRRARFAQGSRPPAGVTAALCAPASKLWLLRNPRLGACGYSSPILKAAINASCGMLTFPYSRIRALPFFCFSSSFFLRLMSPP